MELEQSQDPVLWQEFLESFCVKAEYAFVIVMPFWNENCKQTADSMYLDI